MSKKRRHQSASWQGGAGSGRSAGGSAGGGGRAAPSLAPGALVRVQHNKPWKRSVTMTGAVLQWDGETLVLDRSFSAGGQYDSLHVPKLAGDWGTIEIVKGSWVLKRSYHRVDGTLIGELYNVQTPAEIEPGVVRYVDLEVDVVRMPDGRVAVVDEDDLEAAVRVHGITPDLADKARTIAHRLADILRAGGDWREADAPVREAAPRPATPRGTALAEGIAAQKTTTHGGKHGGAPEPPGSPERRDEPAGEPARPRRRPGQRSAVRRQPGARPGLREQA